MQAADDVLRDLRAAILAGLTALFLEAQQVGAEEAARQLELLDILGPEVSIELSSELHTALEAILTRFDAQAVATRGLILTDADPEQITGNEEHSGNLQAAEIILLVTFWITALLWDAFGWWLAEHLPSGSSLRKMAVAVIDNRTSECCQRVHGQVQAIGDPFILTGEPRFADQMQWQGFHWRCRTSIALMNEENGQEVRREKAKVHSRMFHTGRR